MSNIIPTLRELHRIHRQLADLHDRHERGPRQVKAREANVARLETELEAAREEQKRARMTADEKELQLKSGEDKIRDLRGKLNTCSSNREYQALKEQIAADEMANSVLADEILEAFEKVDELDKRIKEARSKLEQGQADLSKTREAVASERELIQGDIARLEGELKTSEQKLPDDVRDAYHRIIRAKGDDGLAAVEGEICSGCNQNITPNNYNGLTLGQVVFCNSCGRLLYLPE